MASADVEMAPADMPLSKPDVEMGDSSGAAAAAPKAAPDLYARMKSLQ